MELILFILIIGTPLIWLLCFGIAYSIARQKGADSCLGAIMGLLFGPLGILISAVLPVDTYVTLEQQHAALEQRVCRGYLKRCRFCLGYILPAAIVCQHCGRDQDQTSATTTGSKCSSCGAQNDSCYKYCGVCGKPLTIPQA